MATGRDLTQAETLKMKEGQQPHQPPTMWGGDAAFENRN